MIKKFFWDMSWRQGRYEYLHWLLRNIPGGFGIAIRRKVLKRFFCHAGDGLQIYPGVHIRGIHKLSVGKNVYIGLNSCINANGSIDIGDNVLIGPDVKIWSVNHNYTDLNKPISEQGFSDKPVTIGAGCWLGAGCIVLPGVQLSENSIVSAGSVLGIKKYMRNIILAGNPARKIGARTHD
jgi:acetyltransferase-like isoleucine patch superfamily enzyme